LIAASAANQEQGDLTDDLIQETQKRISDLVDDDILGDALFIDWLLQEVQPTNLAHVTSVNNALRWHYYLEILRKEPHCPRVYVNLGAKLTRTRG
jgi:hypothetical protein